MGRVAQDMAPYRCAAVYSRVEQTLGHFEASFGRFSGTCLRKGGERRSEIMRHAGVFPAVYPNGPKNGAWLANWPELILATRARGAMRKNVSVFAGNKFRWIWLA